MDSSVQAKILLLSYLIAAIGLISINVKQFPLGWRRWVLYLLARLYCGVGFHWRSNHRCNYPAVGPALLIANHRSPLDPTLLWVNNHFRLAETGPPRGISFLMASEYYHAGGLVGWISKAMVSIPVERNGRDMKPTREALRRLEQGEMIGVFPEGGINLTDDLLPGNPGVAFLALKAKVPVIPVHIHNAPQGDTMIAPFYSFRRVRISYGEPIDLSRLHDQKVGREVLQEVTDLMMSKIAQLAAEAKTYVSNADVGSR